MAGVGMVRSAVEMDIFSGKTQKTKLNVQHEYYVSPWMKASRRVFGSLCSCVEENANGRNNGL